MSSPPSPPPADPRPDDTTIRILLAGGDPLTRVTITELIQNEPDFSLVTCEKPRDLPETARKIRPSVILLGVLSSEKEDWSLLTRIRHHEVTRHTPMILLCPRSEPDRAARAMTAGADDFIIPERQQELAARIRRHARRYQENAYFRRTAEEFLSLAQSLQDAIVTANADGAITFWNRRAEILFGYSSREILGKPVTRIIPKRFLQAHQEGMRRAQERTGHLSPVKRFQAWGQRKDGSEFPVEISPSHWDFEGAPVLLAVIRDITQEKRVEERNLRYDQSRVAISALLRTALEPLSLKQQLDVALDLILGVPWLSILSKGAIFLHDEQTGELILAAQKGLAPSLLSICERIPMGRCLCGLAAQTREIVFASHVDERHQVSFQGMEPHGHYCVPIRFRNQLFGVITLYLQEGHSRQVEEEEFLMAISDTLAGLIKRKKVDEELRHLAAAVRQSEDMILITNERGAILYVNPAFERVTGYSRAESMGRNPRFLKADRQSLEVYNEVWETLSRGETWRGRFSNRRKDGALFEVESAVSPMRDESGHISSFVAVSRDVTERTRLENQLRQAQKLKAIGTLVNGIAHDFSNILGTVMGYTELAMKNVSTKGKARRHLQKILKASARAKDLITQLLTFSRQGGETELRPMLLAPLVREVVNFMRATLPASIIIRLRTHSPHGAVLADPTQIHQIIMNLCTNAEHAMRKRGGLLEITLQEAEISPATASTLGIAPGGYLLLSVCDTGDGMPNDVRERLFEPFFTTKGVGEGTGLGLSVVHGIVQSLSGAITVESEPGEGTTFQIYLPRITLPECDAPEIEVAQDPRGGGGRLLLVDTHEDWLEIAKEGLEGMGFEVVTCQDPRMALEWLQEEADLFDAVVTEEIMPHLRGGELLEKIQKMRPGLPVLLCCDAGERMNLARAVSEGYADFVEKPALVQTLALALDRVVDPRDKRRP